MSTLSHQETSSLTQLVQRLPAKQRMEALLSAPDAAAQVAALDALELHEIIREIGLDDASGLALLATPEQIQRFVDFDGWRRDHFVPERFEEWLEMYLRLEDEDFARFVMDIDPEILPLYLKHHLVVYLADEHGEPPEDAVGIVEASPGRSYFIVYPDDSGAEILCRTLINKVYDTLGVMKGWMMLESTRWEIESEMEEVAFRFRGKRLEEHGFRSLEEAHAMFAPVDPEAIKAEAVESLKEEPRTRAGAVAMAAGYPHALAALGRNDEAPEGFLRRALESLDANGWALMQPQLSLLGNAAATLAGIEPGDREGGRRIFERTLGVLNVGLEFLVDRDEARAVQLLVRTPLRRIAQAGTSLIVRLKQQAHALVERQQITITSAPASLLNHEEQALIAGLLKREPVRDADTGEGFRSLADIESAARRIALIGFKEAFFFGLLKFDRSELAEIAYRKNLNMGPETLQFEALLATLVLRDHLKKALGVEPLDVADIPTDAAQLTDLFEGWGQRHLPPAQSPLYGPAHRLLSETSRRVVEDLGHVAETVDPKFITAVLLNDDAAADTVA